MLQIKKERCVHFPPMWVVLTGQQKTTHMGGKLGIRVVYVCITSYELHLLKNRYAIYF